MKFIRHILSHLLLFTLLVAVCAVYFYRHQVLPERYALQIDHYAEAIHPKLVNIASVKPEDKGQQPEVQTEVSQSVVEVAKIDEQPDIKADDVAVADEAKDENQSEVTKGSDAVSEAGSVKEKEQQNEIAEAKPEEKVTAEDVVIDQEKTTVTDKSNEDTRQVAEEEQGTTVSEDKAVADYHAVLRDARLAFGQGNMDLAVKKYSELIELENDEADFHGELGNVYYAMGNWEQAGISYYEAATRLIENGQMAQVTYLQRVIQGLDAEKAEKLAQQLAKTNQ